MQIKQTVFKTSSSKLSQVPEGDLPEFAFIGRSNVGKSSLINMITGNSGLAKVSSTPGKTQLINHFLVDERWYLVDLPGYGYARVSKKRREKFSSLITDYVLRAPNLHFLFVLIDSRLEPQAIDLEFIDNLGRNGVPFGLIFTKTDKQSAAKTTVNVNKLREILSQKWEEIPPVFLTSSEKKAGREEILTFIGECLSSFGS